MKQEIHLSAVSGYRCSKCEYSAATQEGLTVHMSQMHKERYECKDCSGLVLNTKSQWQEHLRTYHNNNAMMNNNKDKQAVAAVSDSNQSPLSLLGGQMPHIDPQLMANLIAMMPFLQAATAQGAMASMAAAFSAMQQPLHVDSSMSKGAPPETDTPSPQVKYTRNYQCPHEPCGYASRESRAYLHHLRDEHDETIAIFYCDLCSYASKHLAKVKRHTALIHGQDGGSDDVKSETVDGEDEDSDRLMISESPEATTASETPTQQCEQCPYSTTDPARFKKHLRCHQSTAETACRHCDFRTVYSWNLDRHVKCHMAIGRYTCLRCSFSQNTRQSMTFHLQHHHRIQNEAVATQTDGDWDDLQAEGCPFLVAVEREPFIFEKHAVRFNQHIMISDKEKDNNNGREKEPTPPASQQMTSKENGGKDFVTTPTNQKSRREVANPANTLDGLVAQREAMTPDGLPAAKRYLSEHEAIESPLDDKEIKNFETDPDVSTRTCSICGYQGKWISEMIRHKRVHTNERPFKCKYCSRTSKWKADLIRHVAKSHGIRVVSKYSRSKTFDSNPTVMRALKEAHGFIDGDANSNAHSPTRSADSPISSHHNSNNNTSTISVEELPGLNPRRSAQTTDNSQNGHHHPMLVSPLTKTNHRAGSHPPPERAIVGYKCVVCAFEQEHRAVLYDHLSNVHNLAPYQCTGCELTSLYRKAAIAHCRQCQNGMMGFVENLEPIYQTDGVTCDVSSMGPDAKRARLDKRSSNDQETEGSSSVSSLTAPESPSNLSHSTASPPAVDAATHCDVCPFLADTAASLVTHKKAHEPPKGLINYKCAFCAWFSKKKTAVLEHMRVHTDDPEQFMAEVERNLITPASTGATQKSAAVVKQEQSSRAMTKSQLPQLTACRRAESMPSAMDIDEQVLTVYPTAVTMDSLMNDHSATLLSSPSSSALHGNDDDKDDDCDETDFNQDEAYVHAGHAAIGRGLNFALNVPREIQKVVATVGGGERRPVWKCRYCAHVSKRRANVRMHEKKHFKRNPAGFYKCPECSFRADKLNLNEHYPRIHMKNAPTPVRFPCSNCPAEFSTQSDLEVHMGSHSASHPFPCDQCDYATMTERELAMHKMAHDDYSAIENAERTKSQLFSSPSLTPSSHSSRKPFSPSLLGSSFNDSSASMTQTPSLMSADFVNELLHESASLAVAKSTASSTGALPKKEPAVSAKPKKYMCTKCDARFSDNTQLKRHVKFHGVDLKHSCPLCDYAVPFPINLVKHLKSHHSAHAAELNELVQMVAQPVATAVVNVPNENDHDELFGNEQLSSETAGELKIKISLGKRRSPSPTPTLAQMQ